MRPLDARVRRPYGGGAVTEPTGLAELRPVATASSGGAVANLRPFRRGTSGNPTGRPKGQAGFAAMIRARTHQGRDLLEFVFAVMSDPDEDTRVRLDAATWLANRAFGAHATDAAPTSTVGAAVLILLPDNGRGDRDPD